MTDIIIRHAHIVDYPALGQIIVKATQDAFRGRVPDYCLKWLSPEESAANWAKNFKTDQTLESGNYLFVAESNSGGVVGLALLNRISQPNDTDQFFNREYSHELRSIQIHPTWQQQGIGQRLVSRVANKVIHDGSINLLVRMLVENPNMGFYEH